MHYKYIYYLLTYTSDLQYNCRILTDGVVAGCYFKSPAICYATNCETKQYCSMSFTFTVSGVGVNV